MLYNVIQTCILDAANHRMMFQIYGVVEHNKTDDNSKPTDDKIFYYINS